MIKSLHCLSIRAGWLTRISATAGALCAVMATADLHAQQAVVAPAGIAAAAGSAAQDPGDVDLACRTASDLDFYPGVFSRVIFSYDPPPFQPTSYVDLYLNANHRLVTASTCDQDKIKVNLNELSNVCGIHQFAPGHYALTACDCRFDMVFSVKAKFSQNYNINGGSIDPRRSSLAFLVPKNPLNHPQCQWPPQ